MLPPTLTTTRLRLRGLRDDDAEVLVPLCNDIRVAGMVLTMPHPYTIEHAREFLAKAREGYARGSAMPLLICPRGASGDELSGVGCCGLRIEPEHARAELGYWIGVDHWGKGYATEAARAVMDFGFTSLGLRRIYASHYTINPASGKVLEKIGMQREGMQPAHIVRFGQVRDSVLYGKVRGAADGRQRP